MMVAGRLSFLLIFFSLTAMGDAALKAKALDDYLAVGEFAGRDVVGTADFITKDLVEADTRIRTEDKKRMSEGLLKALAPEAAEVIAVRRQFWDQNFSEPEVLYLLNLAKSPLGTKWLRQMEKVDDLLAEETKKRVAKHYQKVTGQSYPPPAAAAPTPPRIKVEPNWLTRFVWWLFPEQKNACDCG